MATPPNKPRDIKDLKARLGKGAVPGQSGLSQRAPGTGSVPPPAVGGFPMRASAPPPGGLQPVVPPGGIVAPPFARPAPSPGAPGRPSAPPPKPAGPFEVSGTPIVAEKKVTLVIDDSAVKEDEIGRKSRVKNIVLVAIGAGLGLVFGFGIGSTGSERTQYNLAVVDGKEIYARINTASTVLEQAKGHLKKAVAATSGGPGKAAHIDYAAIEELVKLENPFTANEFHGRRYKAFPQNVVNDLFDYYNNINILWTRFTVIQAKTSGENKRRVLDESAKAAEALMSSQYGLVLAKSGDAFIGGMVVMRPVEAGAAPAEEGAKAEKKEGEAEDGGGAPKFLVATREGGREVERFLFQGQEDFAEGYDKYVIAIDKGRSMGLLGEPAKLFGDLRGDLTSTQALMDTTIETQGRLIQELGKVAALKEQKFF